MIPYGGSTSTQRGCHLSSPTISPGRSTWSFELFVGYSKLCFVQKKERNVLCTESSTCSKTSHNAIEITFLLLERTFKKHRRHRFLGRGDRAVAVREQRCKRLHDLRLRRERRQTGFHSIFIVHGLECLNRRYDAIFGRWLPPVDVGASAGASGIEYDGILRRDEPQIII